MDRKVDQQREQPYWRKFSSDFLYLLYIKVYNLPEEHGRELQKQMSSYWAQQHWTGTELAARSTGLSLALLKKRGEKIKDLFLSIQKQI